MNRTPHTWWRVISALIVFAVAIWTAEPNLTARSEEDGGFLPGEVTVKLRHVSNLAAVTAAHGLDSTPIAQFGSRPIYRLRIIDGAEPPVRAAQLEGDPRVLFAEPNYIARAPEWRSHYSWAKADETGAYQSQWAPDIIRLADAHAITRGAGVTVAVLDTGVDTRHPALASRLVAGYDFVDLDTDPGEGAAYAPGDAVGHGTHVAGLVALAAPESAIMPVRVLDANGIGNVWVLAEAIAWAANPDGDPATDDGAEVINLSLGTLRETELLEDVASMATCSEDDDIDEDDDDSVEFDDDCLGASSSGIVIVAAAGNNGSDVKEFPAAETIAGLISVTASARDDTLANFGNYGAWVDVAAPGVDILSSMPDEAYGVWSGSSMATALTSGQVALVRSADPSLNAATVANWVVATAQHILSPVPRRIDAGAAVHGP